MAHIRVCVWTRIHIWICIYTHVYIYLIPRREDKVYTPKLEILNMHRSHCCISLHSYPAQGSSCTAQATSEHQDTGEVSSPGPQVLPPLCSKLGWTWTVVPTGLTCGQGHGDIHVLPSLRLSWGSCLGKSTACLVVGWHVHHHHGEEREAGFRVGEELQVNGTLSCNLLILPFSVLTQHAFNIFIDV